MNQTEQMRELCPTCGEIEPRTGNCGTSDNDNVALCKKALSHVNETPKNEHDSADVLKPAKLVRLTDQEIFNLREADNGKLNFVTFREFRLIANATMAAMEEKNK